MKEITASELDNFLIEKNGPFLQSSSWASFQNGFQRKSWFARLGRGVGSIIKYELPFGKNYLYLPKGPVAVEHWGDAINEMRELALSEKSIFFRWDPEILVVPAEFEKFGLKKSPKETQPKQTILIELSKSEEQLLAEMHSKTRYNIKLAEKKELGIRNQESGIGFGEVGNLFQETAKRDGFHLHPKEYYEKMLLLPEVKLFAVYQKDTILAAALVSMFAGKCVYLHGASDHAFRQLMAPYLLHWEIIKSAKAAGLKQYDLGGVAPANQPSNPWAGITRFKSGFGGEYVEYAGSWDYVMSKVWYEGYRIMRKIL
jgi:peptidoglycan pentaglycine glycine transferase (the first glycine)